MKEIIGIAERIGRTDRIDRLRAAGLHTAWAVCGWVISRAALKGGILPFGLSLLCGMTGVYLPATTVGVFAGYFFPAVSGGGFRYLAAIFCMLSVKILLGNQKRLAENPFWLSLLCFGVEIITGFVSLAQINLPVSVLISEAVLAGGGTFFVAKTVTALSENSGSLPVEGLTAVLITVNMLLIGLQQWCVAGVSLGWVGSVLLVLLCARYGGILSGAISGVAVAFGAMLTGTNTALCVSFALAGLLAGVLVPYGKYAQVGGLFGALAVGLLSSGGMAGWVHIIEILISTGIFLVLPRSIGVFCGRLFCALPQILTQSGLRKSVSIRLEHSADALKDIAQTVDRVADELGRLNAPDYSRMIGNIEQETCNGCKLRKHCWEVRRNETMESVLALTKAVKCGETDLIGALPDAFKKQCLRPENMVGAVSRNYTAYAAKLSAETKVDEVRSVLSEEFRSIAGLLDDLRYDLEREERFDHAAALNVASALRRLNIRTDECSCTVDQFGRMTVRAKLKRNPDTVLNKRQIMKAVSLVCERNFDIPSINEIGNNVFLGLSERTVLSVQTGIAQISADEKMLCGDTCRWFFDGTGHYYLLLSDGMGTGSRAAIDSSMTSGLMARMLRAGFGFDCALRILNSAMLFKSSDESLATVDLVRIDLYNGDTRLFKAGAAQTVVRKGQKTGIAESRSLPIGILQDVGFDQLAVRLHTGDIILMLSDGATADGTAWIEQAARDWADGSAEDLAEQIADEAHRRQPNGHADDITVLAAIIGRNI